MNLFLKPINYNDIYKMVSSHLLPWAQEDQSKVDCCLAWIIVLATRALTQRKNSSTSNKQSLRLLPSVCSKDVSLCDAFGKGHIIHHGKSMIIQTKLRKMFHLIFFSWCSRKARPDQTRSKIHTEKGKKD